MKDLRFVFADKTLIAKCDDYRFRFFIRKTIRLVKLYQSNGVITNKDFENHSQWADLKLTFWEKQDRRCAICEKELNDINSFDVEHYVPKTKFWWLAYHVANYYVACGTCNRIEKNDEFPFFKPTPLINYEKRKLFFNCYPLLINPLHENPYDYFRVIFRTDAKTNKKVVVLAVLKQLDALQHKKAEETINILNLNLEKTIIKSRLVQIEWNIKLYNKLFKLAQKVINKEPDLQEYFDSLDEDYKNLGYTAMIMKGQVEII
jgi:uncharacterized protein (TIGR02646 family)